MIIKAEEAGELATHRNLFRVFNEIHSRCMLGFFYVEDVRLYPHQVEILKSMGYNIMFSREHHSGLSEYWIGW